MVKTKSRSPNSFTKWSVCASTGFPKCPTMIPAKRTPAVPSPTPRNFKLPKAIPRTQTKARAPMVWATGWVRWSSKSQLMNTQSSSSSCSSLVLVQEERKKDRGRERERERGTRRRKEKDPNSVLVLVLRPRSGKKKGARTKTRTTDEDEKKQASESSS